MTVFYLMAISFALLFVPLDTIALTTHEAGSLKFLINIFTHQLGHGNFQHLLGNYMIMIPFALFLEKKIGQRRFLGFYFFCGGMSALTFILSAPWSLGMIGSSGAAFGVMVGAASLWGTTKWQRAVALLLTTLVLLNQALMGWADPTASTAYWGHFGGAFGALLLLAFFPSIQSKSKSDLK